MQVGKNKSATFDLADNDKFTVAKNVEEAAARCLGQAADQVSAEYATRASYNNYPYGYGVSDLNYYGSYSNIPGYGTMWQPYFAGAGGARSRMARGCSIPGIGYTWVSAYPWGWMPYRYGSWAFVPGYGWMWAPGGVRRMVYDAGVDKSSKPVQPTPARRCGARHGSRWAIRVLTAGGPPRVCWCRTGPPGIGIPRGTVSNLGKVSHQVQQNGFATVRTAPPARSAGCVVGGGSSGARHDTQRRAHEQRRAYEHTRRIVRIGHSSRARELAIRQPASMKWNTGDLRVALLSSASDDGLQAPSLPGVRASSGYIHLTTTPAYPTTMLPIARDIP